MKYLILLMLTSAAFGQIVPLKSDSRPAGTASRPSKWIVEQSEKLMAVAKHVDDTRHGALDLQMQKPIGSWSDKKQFMNKRSDAFRAMIQSLEKQVAVEKEIADGLAAGKDNDYGWVQIGDGVEIKMIPGWYRAQKTTRLEIIEKTDLDAQSALIFERDCYEAYVQPILVKVDAARVDAYKVTFVFFDKFNTPISTAEIRRDEIEGAAEVVIMSVRSSASKLSAAMANKKFDIPFEIAHKEVVPKLVEVK